MSLAENQMPHGAKHKQRQKWRARKQEGMTRVARGVEKGIVLEPAQKGNAGFAWIISVRGKSLPKSGARVLAAGRPGDSESQAASDCPQCRPPHPPWAG